MATLGDINDAFGNDGESHGHPGSVGYGSGNSGQSKGALTVFGDILHKLTPEKKIKADGQPPKRRGPKPDSKPALTRRQELNRQAQRTHRERKELYIKALEQEVMRLKDVYGDICRERDGYAEENRKVRELLASQGLSHLLDNLPATFGREPSSSGSISGSYQPASTMSDRSPLPLIHGNGGSSNGHPTHSPRSNGGINYESIGMDFVLALEKPCMDHMHMLCSDAQTDPVRISGHALMATCPPERHLIEHPDVAYPHQMPDYGTGDLLKLLDLSNRLPLDGEITPVMAWAYFTRDPRMIELTVVDFAAMKAELLTKVRCYGFGAVLEEFEVRDALERVFVNSMEMTSTMA